MKRHVRNFICSKFYLDAISFLLIVLFTYTAVTKLTTPDIFRISLQLSPITNPFAGFLVWMIPCTELLIVVALFIPRFGAYGMLSSSLLLLLFTLYIVVMLLFVHDLPCSCGGIVSNLSWNEHLALNLILSFLAFTAFRQLKRKRKGDAENLLRE